MLKKINEQKCVLWFVFPSKRFGSGPSLVELQVKEMKWTLTFSFPCMISYWRCIPETVKLSPYVIFSYFSVFFFVRSFVCIAQYIVEQCNNDWKHVSMYLLPLKITVVNLYCVISPLEFLPLILPMFLFLMSRSTVRSTTRLLPFSLCKVQTAAEKSAY